MAFCRKCGKRIDDEAVICPHCGVPQGGKGFMIDSGGISSSIVDDGNRAWTILSAIVPVLGLILYLFWKELKPKNADACLKGFYISLAVDIGLMLWIVATLGNWY